MFLIFPFVKPDALITNEVLREIKISVKPHSSTDEEMSQRPQGVGRRTMSQRSVVAALLPNKNYIYFQIIYVTNSAGCTRI